MQIFLCRTMTILLVLLAVIVDFAVGYGWEAWPVSQTAVNSFNNQVDYSGFSFSTTVTTTSANDKVLVLVNLNFASAATPNYLQFKLYRGTTDLTTSTQDILGLRVGATTDMICASFVYLDSPSTTGSVQYPMKAIGTGVMSANSMVRHIVGMVIPSMYDVVVAKVFTILTVSTTTYVSMGIDTSVTTAAGEAVYLTITADANPDAITNGKYTLYRNGAIISTNFVLQIVGHSVTGHNRAITMCYTDTPGAGTFVYSVQAAKASSGDGSFTLSEQNRDLRTMVAVVFPSTLVFTTSIVTNVPPITSTTWITVGLDVSVTPFDATDKVLLSVNINFSPVSAASTGAYTIFRGTTNLGDANYGLQTISNAAAAEQGVATMFFLDSPGVNTAVTYSVRCRSVSGSFTVSNGGITRQISAIIQAQTPPTPSPTSAPTFAPTRIPTAKPTSKPTPIPTAPTAKPTASPSFKPTAVPSATPTAAPTFKPTAIPTANPTFVPSRAPTTSPSFNPTAGPTTVPSVKPTFSPTAAPTMNPTYVPTFPPSAGPTTNPTVIPSVAPTVQPTFVPTASPSQNPTVSPTCVPTAGPTVNPTATPTASPTAGPSATPTFAPTQNPTAVPTVAPTAHPSGSPTPSPTAVPTADSTAAPSAAPTALPDDCRAGCSYLPARSTSPVRQLLARMYLPTFFSVSFEVEVPSLGPALDSVSYQDVFLLELNEETGGNLLGLALTPTVSTKLVYNGNQLTSSGVKISDSFSAVYTTFQVTVLTGRILANADTNSTWTPEYAATNVATTGKAYYLYASCAEFAGQSGSIRNIIFNVATEFPTAAPTASPTMIPTSSPSVLPTVVPTAAPTVQPSAKPSSAPTASPSEQPSVAPTAAPSAIPTAAPSAAPTAGPTAAPTVGPTAKPSVYPTLVPSVVPTATPTASPSAGPTQTPSAAPSTAPTAAPTVSPTAVPTSGPTVAPSAGPTCAPTALPSAGPSATPTVTPTAFPSRTPSFAPTVGPTATPSASPSAVPTVAPSAAPSAGPTAAPTVSPTSLPTAAPTAGPTAVPTLQPSALPTTAPSTAPTITPTASPSVTPSAKPTVVPTADPSVPPTAGPTVKPTLTPTVNPSAIPTAIPSAAPSATPTGAPTAVPTTDPTAVPTAIPTADPTAVPTANPTAVPTVVPTATPTAGPTADPTAEPTASPSAVPSAVPSAEPTTSPTSAPSQDPTAAPTAVPSSAPTADPTAEPSAVPTVIPSAVPSANPSVIPTEAPTASPSAAPTADPSSAPTADPSAVPTVQPSVIPTTIPSTSPSAEPTAEPSALPTGIPSANPSAVPSANPSAAPTAAPTASPSADPTADPSVAPTEQPSADPSAVPSVVPSSAPTTGPSAAPTAAPTEVPTEEPTVGPTATPSAVPSASPSVNPTAIPSATPSAVPTSDPSPAPSVTPSAVPSAAPTARPSAGPTAAPSKGPTATPTAKPSTAPSAAPSAVPTSAPTGQPSAVPSAQPSVAADVSASFSAVSVFTGAAAQDALIITLSALPLSSVSLTLSAVDADTKAASDLAFSPASVQFSSASRPSALITLLGVTPGKYTILVTVSGASAAQYPSGAIALGTFTVLNIQAAPAVPQLFSATFSNDGSSVQVKFDAPTNRGGFTNAFICTRLLSFSGDSAATCSWADDSTIAVYPSSSVSADLLLSVGTSRIALLSGTGIKARCTQTSIICTGWLSAPGASQAVAAPLAPASPNVVLTVPATLSGCNSLVVDMSASSGSGGRAWSAPEFTVTSPNADTADIASFLNSAFTFSPPTNVLSSRFPGDGVYTISVKLCNFLGACGQTSRTVIVTKDDALVPSVAIQGESQRTVSRGSSLLLTSVAFTQDCSGGKSTSQLAYSWSVSSGGVAQPALMSTSADPSKFRLPAFALATLTSYDVKLTVTSLLSGRSSSSVASVYVQQSAIVAQVAGGSTQSILVGGTLNLDASSSYDMDVSGKTGAAAGLSFSWACVQTAPVYSTTCPLTISGASAQTLAASADLAAAGSASQITVTVTQGTRTRTATVLVQAQDSSAPVVTITTSSKSLTLVNPADRVTLSASVAVQTSCTAQWSVNDPSVDLTKALTVTSAVIPTGTTRTVSLGLPVNLLPRRASLLFSLKCGQTVAGVTVTTNGPPLPGVFLVSPPSGDEMSQPFVFSASLWSDTDLPLTYQFGFVTASSGAVLVAQGRSEVSYVTSTLAAGAASAQYAVTCTVQVFDSLNAATKATASVIVTPLADQTQLQDILLAQLTANAGSNEASKNTIAVGGASINTVACDKAPDCAGYNRQGCAKVENTCGSCLTGFVGDWGDKNGMCVDATTPVPTTGSGAAGSVCVSDTDCSGYLRCDTTLAAPVCYLPSKSCPADCSGHGTCLMQSPNTLKTVADCKIGDPSCVAVCQCNAGYSSQNCAVEESALLRKQVLRSAFLQSLSQVAESDDVTAESLSAMSTALSSLAQNSFELSQDAVWLVYRIARKILTSAVSLESFSYEQAIGVLQAVDSAAEASLRLNSTNTVVSTAEVMDTILLFNSLMAPQLVAGQANVEYVEDSFRMSTLRQLRGFNSSLAVLAPVTPLEQSINAATSSITIEDDEGDRRVLTEGDDREEFAVSLVTTSASSYGDQGRIFNTNPLHVTVSRSTATPTRVAFTLVHNQAVEFTSDADAAANVFNSTCVDASDFSVTTYTCADSGEVLTHKCFGVPGVMTSHCPVLRPSCGILDTITGIVDTNSTMCEVVRYDSHSTECSCRIKPSSGGRRLNGALDQSGLLDAVSVSVYLGSGVKDTFNSADDLTSLAALKRVLIVILMFSTLWAGGLLMIFGCTWRRALLKKVHAKTDQTLEKKVQTVQISRSPAIVSQYLTDYVIETFPSVFSNKPFFSRLYGEVKRHHRYLTLFTAPETEAGDKQRILIGVELLTVQTMLMFLLAVLYDLQGPSDDGTCQTHVTMESCLSRTSVFDTTQSYCQWVDAGADAAEHTCSYRDPRFTLKIVLYIAVMVSILVSIISFPIDRIFELLSAPVAMDEKVAMQDTALKRLGRRASNVARRASNFALSAAAAAKAKLGRASVIVGTVTRQMPGSTETAHALATASMTVIAENSRRVLQQRQMSQLRTFYDSGGKHDNDDADSHSGSDSSSDSDSDNSASENETTRGPERTSSAQVVAVRDTIQSADLRVRLEKLREAVHCQRRLLKPAEIEEFDNQWGLDPTGAFTPAAAAAIPCFKGRAGAEEQILAELKFVQAETAKKAEKLNIATDAHTGLEILHLFIKDLLGRDTPAAIIFETKSAEDFKHTKVVTRTSKRIAAFLLVCFNAFFVYYAMLTGFRKGISWQRMYLLACIVQFTVEILLFETMECVWINCAIPVLVSDEVRRVGDSITEVVRSLCANSEVEARLFLNAPNYLFVSTNLAKKFPDLMESILVQAYTTHLPGELARKWQVGSIARAQRHQRVHRATLLGTVMAALQYMGTAPFILHRMFIRFVQPFAFSGLVLLWKAASSSVLSITIAAALIAGAIAYGLYRYFRETASAQAKLVTPVSAEYQTAEGLADPDTAKIVLLDNSDDLFHLPSQLGGSIPAAQSRDRSSHRDSSSAEEEKNAQSELSTIVSATANRTRTRDRGASLASSVSGVSEVSSQELPGGVRRSMKAVRNVFERTGYYQSSSSSDSADGKGDAEVTMLTARSRLYAAAALASANEASEPDSNALSAESSQSDSSSAVDAEHESESSVRSGSSAGSGETRSSGRSLTPDSNED